MMSSMNFAMTSVSFGVSAATGTASDARSRPTISNRSGRVTVGDLLAERDGAFRGRVSSGRGPKRPCRVRPREDGISIGDSGHRNKGLRVAQTANFERVVWLAHT